MNLVDTAAAATNLKTFVSLLKTSSLDKMLATKGPYTVFEPNDVLTVNGRYTVFAPSDDAFAKLPKATLEQLEGNPALLKTTLLYHVVARDMPSATAMKLASATTLDGSAKVGLSVVGGSLYVGNAKVVTPTRWRRTASSTSLTPSSRQSRPFPRQTRRLLRGCRRHDVPGSRFPPASSSTSATCSRPGTTTTSRPP